MNVDCKMVVLKNLAKMKLTFIIWNNSICRLKVHFDSKPHPKKENVFGFIIWNPHISNRNHLWDYFKEKILDKNALGFWNSWRADSKIRLAIHGS